MTIPESAPMRKGRGFVDGLMIFVRIAVAVFINLLLLGGVGLLANRNGTAGFVAVVFLVLLWFMEGWLVFVYFHYRQIRRDEIASLLATAAKGSQPLAPALWAYLVDRPSGGLRETLVAASLSLVYWGWYGRHNFDRQTGRVALRLEAGEQLHRALQAAPGVVADETVLAAAVGESTGRLGDCLENTSRWRLTTAWIDLLPRFVYPMLVLMSIWWLVSFNMVFIAPKMEKIFADFKMKLPPMTDWYILIARRVARYLFVVPVLFLTACGAMLGAYSSATFCWYFPVLGVFYRMHIQSRFLKMLGLLLEAGHTVPQALGILHETGYFRGTVERRLSRVRDGVNQGQALEDLLRQQGFVPSSMVPLLHTALKVQNLPWVLSELGEHQARRTVQFAERFTTIVLPFTILAMGVLVGFIAVSLFYPLIKLIHSLGV